MVLTLAPFQVTGRILDIPSETDPIAASYSVRRVQSSYTGPCMRVRRDDAAESDIGFIGTELDITSLLTFTGSNGNAWVVQWYDQSGKGYHAQQSNWDLQPRIVINGAVVTDSSNKQPTIRFDGRQYFDTTYEPTERDVTASAIQTVANAGLENSGFVQGGSTYEFGRWAIDASVETSFPNTEIGLDRDLTFLESESIDNSLLYVTKSNTYGLLTANIQVDDLRVPDANANVINTVTAVNAELGPSEFSTRPIDLPDGETEVTATQRFSGIVSLGNGLAMTIPYDEPRAAVLDESTGTVVQLIDINLTGQTGNTGLFSKGLVIGDYVYLIPYNYTNIVRIQRSAPYTLSIANVATYIPGTDLKLFRDAVLANGYIYCIPYSANNVYRVDLSSFTVTTIGQTLSADDKFATGQYIPAYNCIVCPPYNAGAFLRIDTNTQAVEVIGSTHVNAQLSDGGTRRGRRDAQRVAGGRGYTETITATAALPGDGLGTDTATFQATVQKTKIVSYIDLTNQGSGYTSIPTVRFNSWGGYWNTFPTATATLNNGSITAVTITHGGDGYFPDQSSTIGITFEGGKGEGAEARAVVEGGRIVSIIVDKPGSGYTSQPTVTIQGASTTPASGITVQLKDGAVEKITVSNGGAGYTSPTIQISGGKGVDAQATAYTRTDGKITDLTITTPGTGYQVDTFTTYTQWAANPSVATIIIDPPNQGTVTENGIPYRGNPSGISGQSAQAVARISSVDGNGAITGIEILYAGSGYVTTPNVTLDVLKPGSGAVLTPTFKTDGRLEDITVTNQGSKYLETKAITLGNREPSEAASGGANTRASVYMFLDGGGPSGVYRYRGTTPDGSGKFLTSSVINTKVIAYPYNTYRCIEIDPSNAALPWTERQVTDPELGSDTDFGLGTAKYASLVSTNDGGVDRTYIIPDQHRRVLKATASTLEYLADVNGESTFQGSWGAAALAPQSKVIYAVPRNSEYILTIDTKRDELIELLVTGVVRETRGPNKFSGIAATTNGLLFASPEDGDRFLEINSGATTSRTQELPAPGVKLADGVTIVYPPRFNGTNVDITHITVNASTQTVTTQQFTDTNTTSDIGSFGDGCLLPNGTVAWIPIYTPTSGTVVSPKVVIYNPTTKTITHVSPELDIRYVVPYPSRSAVALSNAQIVWCPKDSTSALVSYDSTTTGITTIGSRVSNSVPYASAITKNGIMTGVFPTSTRLVDDATVPGFTSRYGNRNTRYVDSTVTTDGLLVLAPGELGSFKTYNPTTNTWRDVPGAPSFAFADGLHMGGCVTSSVDGKVYAVPFNHNRVISLDTSNDVHEQFDVFDAPLPRNQNVWRGVVDGGDYIFGVPYASEHVVVIDPRNSNPIQKLSRTALPDDQKTGSSKWWGGVYSPKTGKIYCAPFNASSILVITPGPFPENTELTFIDVPAEYLATGANNRWTNPCLSPDGTIVFTPYNSSGILTLEPDTETVGFVDLFQTRGGKYSTTVLSPSTNTLFLVPLNERSFIEYDPLQRTFTPHGDYGTEEATFRTAAYVPGSQSIISIAQYLPLITNVYPNITRFGYYNGSGSVVQGTVIPEDFKMRLKLRPDNDEIMFHTRDALARMSTPTTMDGIDTRELVFSSPVTPGVMGWFTLDQATNDYIIIGVRDDTFNVVIIGEGGICGAQSFSKNADFWMGILRNTTLACRTGDTTATIPFIFESIYSDGQSGSVGMYSDASRLYTQFRDVEANRQLYAVSGDVGSTFGIGRIFGTRFDEIDIPEVSTTIVGTVSEILVLKTDNTLSRVTFGQNQNTYFRAGPTNSQLT